MRIFIAILIGIAALIAVPTIWATFGWFAGLLALAGFVLVFFGALALVVNWLGIGLIVATVVIAAILNPDFKVVVPFVSTAASPKPESGRPATYVDISTMTDAELAAYIESEVNRQVAEAQAGATPLPETGGDAESTPLPETGDDNVSVIMDEAWWASMDGKTDAEISQSVFDMAFAECQKGDMALTCQNWSPSWVSIKRVDGKVVLWSITMERSEVDAKVFPYIFVRVVWEQMQHGVLNNGGLHSACGFTSSDLAQLGYDEQHLGSGVPGSTDHDMVVDINGITVFRPGYMPGMSNLSRQTFQDRCGDALPTYAGRYGSK